MRFLADENVPGPAVAALRESGHDVLWIKEVSPGAEDAAVLDLAQWERRVVVTADTDFGELVFRSGRRILAVVEHDRVRIRPSSHTSALAL